MAGRKLRRSATSSKPQPTILWCGSRTTATGHVFYAKTHNHSYMGVQTGNIPTYTHFDVPAGMETGPSTLVVVTNGIPSFPVNVTVN